MSRQLGITPNIQGLVHLLRIWLLEFLVNKSARASMSLGGMFFLVLAAVVCLFVWAIRYQKKETARVEAMDPREKANHLFGSINEHLICPHCQTKGLVHARRVSRVVTSTGKVGGILKTDTKSTTVSQVTQHHCEQCGTTWDI